MCCYTAYVNRHCEHCEYALLFMASLPVYPASDIHRNAPVYNICYLCPYEYGWSNNTPGCMHQAGQPASQAAPSRALASLHVLSLPPLSSLPPPQTKPFQLTDASAKLSGRVEVGSGADVKYEICADISECLQLCAAIWADQKSTSHSYLMAAPI